LNRCGCADIMKSASETAVFFEYTRSHHTLMRESFVFVSDVHIAPGNKDRVKRFSGFLDMLRESEVARVYILGDLFDYWVGRGHEKQPEYNSVLAKIRELAESGVQVYLFHGNRDFLLNSRTVRMAGAVLAGDDMNIQLGGKTVHLCHGDHLCKADRAHLALRKCIRSRVFGILFAACPFFVRRRLARKLRDISRHAVAGKSQQTVRFSPHAIEAIFQGGVDVLVCGHTHSRGEHVTQSNGRGHVLYKLGDWATNGCYLLYKDDRFQFLHSEG